MRKFENELIKSNKKIIVGIDEAGRGPIAGPVVAAAVVLNLDYNYQYINDSKKLSDKRKMLAYNEIINNSIDYSVGIVNSEEIDKINILNATKKAMNIALNNLKVNYDFVLIDAVDLEIEDSMSIIKGDAKSISIAAASVIAKVTRDNIMYEYDMKYPNYGFKNHKGYPTKKHKEMIEENGICPIHRRSFSPINKMK